MAERGTTIPPTPTSQHGFPASTTPGTYQTPLSHPRYTLDDISYPRYTLDAISHPRYTLDTNSYPRH